MFSQKTIASLIVTAALSMLGSESAMSQTLYGSAGAQSARENAANVDWAYNWGIEPKHDVDTANFEFVPMIWSGSPTGVPGAINKIFNLEANFGVHVDYVLGFNEPELSTQANMSVDRALATWQVITDSFADTDIKLVSPAVSGAGGIEDWLEPFMAQVELRNNDANQNNDLQVDVIAYHFYTVGFNPQTEAAKLIGQIDDLWETYHRPIWITEFAGTSFSLNNRVHSIEERTAFNKAFLEALMPAFEQRDYVERVAWWQFGALGQPYSALSSVTDGTFTPTGIGEVYSRTTLGSGQSYNFATGELASTDVHYLEGGTLTNSGVAMEPSLRAVDALAGSSVLRGTSDYGLEVADDAFIRVRSGATLRKLDTNTITLEDSPFVNDGSVLLQGGTLLLEDGAQLSGVGSLRIDPAGTLATSGGAGDQPVNLDSTIIILNRGKLHVEDGQTEISQQLRFWSPSEVRTDGDLLLSGFTRGAGRILSTGTGTLFLRGEGEHEDGATVSQGQLVVANDAISATGAGDVLVTGTGTFGGFGLVDGDMRVNAGAAVAPGVSQSSYGTTSLTAFDDGVTVDAINFNFAGVQSDAPLVRTSTLNQGMRLVSGLDFGRGVRAFNADNDGNEFNVAGFPNSNNYGAASNNGEYLTFTIAPVDGLAMVIDDVSFTLRRNGVWAPKEFAIGTTIDGFTSAARWGSLVLGSSDTKTHVFTVTNPSNEPIADEVEIRIIGLQAVNDTGNTHFYAASVDASFTSDPNTVAFDPTGILQLGGNYTQLDFATLKIEMGGTSNEDLSNTQFDQLAVIGNVQLDGTLDLSFVDDYEPTAGDTFDIITAASINGTFSEVVMPANTNLAVNYSNTVVQIEVLGGEGLLGDVNRDNVVDFSDIAPFIRLLASGQYQEEADVDRDGDVSFSDIAPFIVLLQG
ncbi:glycosyl hydrolase [Mariniblastus sp.]|nr:glycosyl hydrolase [Mariniblastus sp.]